MECDSMMSVIWLPLTRWYGVTLQSYHTLPQNFRSHISCLCVVVSAKLAFATKAWP